MQAEWQGKSYRVLLSDLQGRGFSEYEVTDILQQVLPQLAQIQAQGFVHGGISLDTLVQDRQTLLAILMSSNGFVDPSYIAPELLQSKQVSTAGDVYALGMAIVILLTAKTAEALRDNGTWSWQDHCVVSDQFAEFLDRAISDRAEFRYTNAAQMLQRLNLQNTTLVAPPTTFTIPQPNLIQGQSQQGFSGWLWGAIGVGVTVISGIGGFGLVTLLSPKSKQSNTNPTLLSNQQSSFKEQQANPTIASTPNVTNIPTSIPVPSPSIISSPSTPIPNISATSPPVSYEFYHVVNVDNDDVLYVLSAPGVNNQVVGNIPFNGVEVLVTGIGVKINDGGFWLPVRYRRVVGWVNSAYLSKQ